MQRLLRALVAGLSLAAFACSADTPASGVALKQGEQYETVREVQKPQDPSRIAVQEVFWYGCSHCYAFDPHIEAWSKNKPADVDFERLPTALGRPVGALHARAYFAADVLNLLERLHRPIFEAIHVRGLPLDSPPAIAQLFNAEAGVMPDIVLSTLNGFAVDSRARRAEALVRAYGIASVPTVVVGGKYYTNGSMAGGIDRYLQVIDALVEKVREERRQ